MSPEPGAQSAGAEGAADIEVVTRGKFSGGTLPNSQLLTLLQKQHQHITAGPGWHALPEARGSLLRPGAGKDL